MEKSYSESMNLQATKTENDIIKENSGMAGDMAKRFYKSGAFYSYEDLFQVACISILKAWRKYDPSRGCLSTLMHHCIFNDLVKFVKKNKTLVYKEEKLEYIEKDKVYEYFPDLTDDYNQIITMIYEGYKPIEIRNKLNLTKSQYKTILSKIRKMVKLNA